MGLVRSPQNKSVHYRQPQSVRLYKYQTQLKSVFKMSSVCSNASSKTSTALPDHFIDNLNTWWKCSHSSIRGNFSWSTSWIRLRYTCSCSFPKSGSLPGSGQDCLHRTISPASALSLKHDRPRKIPCLLFTLTVDCVNITSLPDKWLRAGEAAVQCNRSCLWVCVCVFEGVFVCLFVCLWVCYHDNS